MRPDDIGICLPVTWRRRSAPAHGVVVSARSTVLPDSGMLPELTLRCVPVDICLLYTSPSPRDGLLSRMPSSA